MERSLLYHCRALLMDEADTLLEGAYVVVEGETISSGAPSVPRGPLTGRSTAETTSSCPAWSTPIPTSP